MDLNVGMSVFYYLVDNWIMWIPGQSYWVPENIRQVNSSGFEVFSDLNYFIGLSKFKLGGYYSFTQSTIRNSEMENDPGLENQLPYTPVHLAAINLDWSLKDWHAGILTDFTGLRYVTTDNMSELPSYYLINIRTGKNFNWDSHLFSLDFRIDNLLNTSYQNVLYRAMPGRTYTMGIHYFINQ